MVNPTANRNGRGLLGCLIPIVIVGAIAYVGLMYATPWFKNQQFQDEMGTVADFEGAVSDGDKLARVRARADSLGLPEEAKTNLSLRRVDNPPRLIISSEYQVIITLPLLGERVLSYTPRVEEGL